MKAYKVLVILLVCILFASTLGAQNEETPIPETVVLAETSKVMAKVETPKFIELLVSADTEEEEAEPEVEEPVIIEVNSDDAVLIAKTLYGEYRGESELQQAAVVWTILNRCDAWDMSVEEVVTAPYQFLGYKENHPVLPYLYNMAVDVMTRWEREKLGETDVGRILPKDYMWFVGNGYENRFRNAYDGYYTIWDWSLPDPYTEGENNA